MDKLEDMLQSQCPSIHEAKWMALFKQLGMSNEVGQAMMNNVEKKDGQVGFRAIIQALTDNNEPRLLLVSDSLPFHEEIIKATKDCVTVVPVQYGSWQLNDLKDSILMRAGKPEKQFASVGLLDHGAQGEFCLLASAGGGSIDLSDFKEDKGEDLVDFFQWLAGFVRAPKRLHEWQTDLSSRIDLLACEVAKDHGKALIDFLEEATKVNWAASVDMTGAGEAVEGGFDWDMETEEDLGPVASCYFHVAEIAKWEHHCWRRRMSAHSDRKRYMNRKF